MSTQNRSEQQGMGLNVFGFFLMSLMLLASGLNMILNFNKNNFNLLKNFKIRKMYGKQYKRANILKMGGIFALIAGLVFIFSAINVSAGGCCCYADSCLNLINNSANVNTSNAYLDVSKFVDKNILQVGDEVGYTIVVRNLGNITAYDVTVNDTLPADISSVTLGDINYIYDSNGNGGMPACQFLATNNNVSGKVLYCKINKIPAHNEIGANVTIYFKAKVTQHTNAPVGHTNNVNVNGFYAECKDTNGNIHKGDGTCPCNNINNCNQIYGVSDVATIQSNAQFFTQPDGANNLKDNATVYVAGIDVTKYANTSSALQAGDVVVFHITVTNTGDLKVCNITVHDRLPSALEFFNISSATPITHSNTSRDVYINLTNCLNGSLSTTINITTKVSTSATTSSSLSNFVEINGTIYDNGNQTNTDVSDNYTTPPQYYDPETGTNQTPSVGKAELSLNKIAMDPWTRPDRMISYRVEANTGGTDIKAYGVTIQDALPPGFQYFNNIRDIDGCNGGNPTTTSGNGTTGNITFNLGNFSGACKFTYTVFVPWNTLDGHYRNNQTLTATDKNNNILANVIDNAVVTVNGNARLTVNKDVVNPRIFQPNDVITYSLTISNEGDNEIHNVNVTDLIPYGMNYSSSWINNNIFTVVNESISPDSTTVQVIGDMKYTDASKGYKAIWYFDKINAKTTKVIYLNLTVTSDSVGGSSMNKVEVTGKNPNNDTLLWKDIASSARIGKASLILEKFSDSATVAAGEDVSYTIYIKNIGEGNAQNLSIRDIPGSQMQLGTITSASCNGNIVNSNDIEGGPATAYGGTITYYLNNITLQAGKYCEIHYKASTASTSQEGLYINQVDLNWSDMFGTEQMHLKQSASVMILKPDAFMSVKKEANVSHAQPGDEIVYTITIENKGGEQLKDVSINDTLPDYFANTSQAAWGNFSCSNMPNGTCVKSINGTISNYTGEGIGAYTTVTLKINVTVTTNATEGLNTNKITVDAKRPLGTPIKGTATHILEVNRPHILISKWASTTMREPGQNVTFYIEVKNTGAGDAKNITIIDNATPFEHIGDVEVVSGDCKVNKSGNLNIATFWINDNGTFVAYKTCIFKYVMKVPANTSDNTYTNNASLSYQDFNNTKFSESAGTDVLVTINLFPDVEKIANDTSLQPGDRVNFTINVRNYGTATMTNGKITDTLPQPGFKCINANGISNGINCSCVNDTTVICNLTDLGGNTINPPLSMWVEAEINGSATEGANDNTVFLNGTRPDGVSINRTTTAKVFVNVPKPQLEIYKWTDVTKATPNSTLIYYVLVKNTGDGDAYNLTINDDMDFGVITIISSDCGAICNNSAKQCNISLLKSAQQCQIRFVVSINENATDGNHINTVNVSGKMKDGSDINKTQLNDNETIEVRADVRLSVIKKANTTEANAGDNVTYTVTVKNDGFNGVYVNVTDIVPTGFTCNTTNYSNVWINGNDDKKFEFNCNVNSSATQGNNTVVVNGVAVNGHTENGSATETIVLNRPDLKIFKSSSVSNTHPNDTITYTIIVRNDGTASAKDIVIDDDMQNGLIYNNNVVIDNSASTGCTQVDSSSAGGNFAQFNISQLDSGKLCKFSYQVNVSGSAQGDQQNNVSMNAKNMDDSNITQNAYMNSSANINATADVKLSVIKKANTTEANAGDNVTYTVTVKNDGFNGVYVNVTDNHPTGYNCTPSSGYPNQWIGGSGEKTFEFNCTVNSSATDGRNNVSVNGVAENGQIFDKNATATIVLNTPKLEIIKEVVTGTVEQGGKAIYKIIVRNTGTAPVKNINITDNGNGGGAVFTSSFGGPNIDISASTGCTAVSVGTFYRNGYHEVNFTTVGIMNPGQQCVFTYELKVQDGAEPTNYTNTANITGAYNLDNSIYTQTPEPSNDAVIRVIPQMNVSFTKNGTNIAQPGYGAVNFTINITNNNPTASMTDVTFNDTLPDGFTCLSNSTERIPAGTGTPQINCTCNGKQINCDIGTIAGGSTVIINISANVSSSADASSTNHANVTYNVTGYNGSSFITSEAAHTVTIVKPHLSILKSNDATGVRPGQNVNYTITVKNTGDGNAYNITLNDILDDDLTHVAVTNMSCIELTNSSVGSNSITFNISSLANNTNCKFNVTVHVPERPINDTIYNNTVNITDAQFGDGTHLNLTYGIGGNATSDITVKASTNVSVVKSANTTSAQPGDSVIFTINVTNYGAENSVYNVKVNDALPTGFTIVGVENSSPACDNTLTSINCTFATLSAGGLIQINITAKVGSDALPTSTNTANVSYELPNGTTQQTDNPGTTEVTIVKPHLSILKSNNATGVRPGQNVNYTITVKNTGGGDAKNITIRDVVDSPLTHVGYGNISCQSLVCALNGQVAECNISFLDNNSLCQFNLTVNVLEQINNSIYNNSVNITDAYFMEDTLLNTSYGIGGNATSHITVGASTNVSVVKSANTTSAQPGDSVIFTINVTNYGAENSVYNVKVNDALPTGFTIVGVENSSPACDNTLTSINCTFATLSAGGLIQINITAKVGSDALPTSTNTANVSYELPNGTTQQTDNPGQTSVTINKPNVTIQKTPKNPKASRDQNISYEIRIKNNGQGTAYNLTIEDVLPSANMNHTSNGTNVSGCSQTIISASPLNTNTTTFTLVNLSSGQECTFNYTVYIDENIIDGNYTNIATITGGKFGDGSDMNSSYGNNSNSNATVEVTTTIIPSIEKIPSSDKVQPGDTINFTIVIKNNGNNDWKNVKVRDVLPAGFVYNKTINVTPSDGGYTGPTYNTTTGELNYTDVTVPRFGNWTVIVVANVTSGASSPSTNRVNASSPDNRSVATIATVVVNKPELIVSKEPVNYTYLPGNNVTYRIKITNIGTGDAYNVTIDDTFTDSEFYHNGNTSIIIAHCGSGNNTNVSIISGNGTNNAIFALNDTFVGQEYCEFTYTVQVDENHEDGLYANYIKVNSTMGDNTPLPVAKDSAQILIKADVSMRVTKTSNATNQEVNAGDYINFTITVYEDGNSPIYNANVSDTVPDGCVVTNVTNDGSNINGSWNGRNVNFIIGKINAKSHVDLNITCYINHSMFKGWNTNSVSVLAKKPNWDEIYGSASTQIKMLLPDISWTKESLNKTILAGQKETYKIRVTNKGDGIAHNLIIYDYLPKGAEGNWTYVDALTINDSCGYTWNATNISTDGNIVKFFLDKMNGSTSPVGTECAFTFEVQIPAGTTSVMYANTIGGSWSYGDINNNTVGSTISISNQTPGEGNVYVNAGGGINIKKESDKNVYKFGEIINYTIIVYSNGIPTTNLTVKDVLPKGLQLESCEIITANVTNISKLTNTSNYNHYCEITYTQSPNNQTQILIRARVTQDISDQQITNTVTVNGILNQGTTGQIPLHQESTKSVNLENPDVTISKWADASDVEPGQEVTFYVQIQNPSETNLNTVNVVDNMPPGFEYVEGSSKIEGQQVNYTNISPFVDNVSTPQNITWNVSNISGKTTKLLTYKAKVHCNIVEGKDANVNKVCVNYQTHDNETGSACTNYTMSGHLANLTINKYADKDSVKWFDVVEYTVIIKNPALNSAHAILKEINDTMAKNLKYINHSATINGEEINPNVIEGNYSVGTTLIWNGSTINDTAVWVGTKVILKYRVLVMPGSNGILDNNVSLEYYDPLPGYFDPKAVFKTSFRSNLVRDGYTPKQSIVETGNTKLMLGDEINTPVATTSTMHLKQGWNLISLPIQPEDTNIDAVLNSIKGKYTDVFTYKGRWVYKSEYMNKWFGDLSNLEAGKGYWIKVNEDCNLTIDGLKVKSANISLEQGWNLIGPVTTTQDNISLDNLNVQYTDVFTYEGRWVYKSEYMNKWFGDLSNLEAGKGYWVKVENNGQLAM